MENSVLLALISAGVSLVSVGITFIASRSNLKLSKEIEELKSSTTKEIEKIKNKSNKEIEELKGNSNKDIEGLKLSTTMELEKIKSNSTLGLEKVKNLNLILLEKFKQSFANYEDDLKKKLEATNGALILIQKIIDEVIQVVLNSIEDSVDFKYYETESIKYQKEIDTWYAEKFIYLDQIGSDSFHKAKRVIHEFNIVLSEVIPENGLSSLQKSEIRNLLNILREEKLFLHDYQNQIKSKEFYRNIDEYEKKLTLD